MTLSGLDWFIIIAVLAGVLMVGFWVSKRAGSSSSEFFLSGRDMPWWLLGFSMVATTFSTDTPNLVTDIVRQDGVSGNWVWWALCLTGMLTVFIYAKLWRKSGVNTDLEFYELRYSGKTAGFLRGFRAVYLGLAFNVLSLAGVILAAIKIGEIMLGWSPFQTIGISCAITLVFSVLGGLRGVILTDFFLFIISMVGSVGAAYIAVQQPEVGGLSALMSNELITGKLNFFPSTTNWSTFLTVLVIPLTVQWWSSWYPGAEPGGGGYIAQRMLAAKDESHAIKATFFFTIAHYALRPWPWILVALASLLVFPDLESIQTAFPNISDDKLANDLAYPAMMTLLPSGLLGLVIVSLTAAFMSTVSTLLNWGASYLVYDFYKRFVNVDASEKRMVMMGRVFTVLIMLLSAAFALMLTNAKELFDIIIMFGAGTGLIFILRWFWWRINAWSEIIAMIFSGVIALLMAKTSLFDFVADDFKFAASVLFTTIVWFATTYLTRPTDQAKLISFIQKVNPGGPGWKSIYAAAAAQGIEIDNSQKWAVPQGIVFMLIGCVFVYTALFGIGYLLYGKTMLGVVCLIISTITGWYLIRKLETSDIL